MNSNWRKNRELAKFRNTEPTMTDQSAARETDINVIVAQYTVHGQMPATTREPMYEDFSVLPGDLRGFIEQGRELAKHRERLPKELRDLTTEQLLALTPQQLREKLTPPAQPQEKPTEEGK